MPIIVSKDDLSPLVNSREEIVKMLDATERSLVDVHTGDHGHLFFTDLPVVNEGQVMITGSSVGKEYVIVRVFPGVLNSGPTDNCTFIAVLDPETGGMLALLAGDDLNRLRTAAAAGLGARHLAAPDASVLTVLGSSEQARGQALTVTLAVPQIKEVVVWSPTQKNREAFAEQQTEVLGLPVRALDTAEEAVGAGDVIVAAGRIKPRTAFEADWVKPGALAISVTMSTPVDLDQRSRYFVPTVNRAQLSAFGFSGRYAPQSIDQPPGTFQLADVIQGNEVPRTDKDETVVFELANPYLWDQPIMTHAYEWVMKQGVGLKADLTG